MILRKTISILVVVFTFFGCNLEASGIAKNNEIKQAIRDEIKSLNDRLFQAIRTNNPDEVRELLSDEVLKQQSKAEIDTLLKQLTAAVQTKKYRILDEYYVSNFSSGVPNVIPSRTYDDSKYTIHYKALNEEMVTSLMIIPSGLNNEILLLLVYGKFGNDWKINIFQFGQYSILNKTAIDYYRLAKASYHHSDMIDAVSHIVLAKQCLIPGGEFFSYEKEKEIDLFYEKVLKEANAQYPLPRIVEGIDTKPKLFLITPQILDDGCFPVVCYLSKINLKDTMALKQENDQLKLEVNQLFHGINRNKKRVLYRAYNELPDGNKPLAYYGFVDELKN